jgi:KaiC/GvpD/RAD55 family RecA-like ATPase
MTPELINSDGTPMNGVIPTGIPSLDPLLFGGLPLGTLVLLIGESGAGCEEFTYTSTASLSQMKENAGSRLAANAILPENILFITVTRRKGDIINEVSRAFARNMREELQHIDFFDLSDMYFEKSLVPLQWYSQHSNIVERMQSKTRLSDNILTALANKLDQTPRRSMLVLNTLTELATQFNAEAEWPSFVAYIRGLQRVLTMWDSCMYLILAKGVLNQWQECELKDVCDAVVHFQWEVSPTAKRQRVLYIDKFRGILPQLEEKELVKFLVKITPAQGFEVNNIRAVV